MAHGAAQRAPDTHGAAVHEEDRFLYGIMAEFAHPDAILHAAERAYAAGYRRMDAYTPFAVEGLDEKLGFRDYKIPWTMFFGGALGAAGGFALLTWALTIEYPLNVGGRPLFGWPHFVPITFETMVLLASLAGVVGMLAFNGLPQPYHPVFDHPDFDRASSDRFFLCLQAEHGTDREGRVLDGLFRVVREGERVLVSHQEALRFMQSLGALEVSELELRK